MVILQPNHLGAELEIGPARLQSQSASQPGKTRNQPDRANGLAFKFALYSMGLYPLLPGPLNYIK